MYAVCRTADAAHRNHLAHVRSAHDDLRQTQQRLEPILTGTHRVDDHILLSSDAHEPEHTAMHIRQCALGRPFRCDDVSSKPRSVLMYLLELWMQA